MEVTWEEENKVAQFKYDDDDKQKSCGKFFYLPHFPCQSLVLLPAALVTSVCSQAEAGVLCIHPRYVHLPRPVGVGIGIGVR